MKSKDNAAGFGILAILILLVLLPLAAVLFQVVCPGLQIEKFDPSNLKLVLDVFVRPLWKKAFFNSFFLSIGTTVIGLLDVYKRQGMESEACGCDMFYPLPCGSYQRPAGTSADHGQC